MKLRNIGYAAFIAATAAAFVIGSGGASEAKGKKKEAAPPPTPPVFCFQGYAPVCAVKGGKKYTYANACWAAKDGAKVVSEKACPVKAAAKDGKKKGGKKAAKKPAKKK
jgi:hypothetical protein